MSNTDLFFGGRNTQFPGGSAYPVYGYSPEWDFFLYGQNFLRDNWGKNPNNSGNQNNNGDRVSQAPIPDRTIANLLGNTGSEGDPATMGLDPAGVGISDPDKAAEQMGVVGDLAALGAFGPIGGAIVGAASSVVGNLHGVTTNDPEMDRARSMQANPALVDRINEKTEEAETLNAKEDREVTFSDILSGIISPPSFIGSQISDAMGFGGGPGSVDGGVGVGPSGVGGSASAPAGTPGSGDIGTVAGSSAVGPSGPVGDMGVGGSSGSGSGGSGGGGSSGGGSSGGGGGSSGGGDGNPGGPEGGQGRRDGGPIEDGGKYKLHSGEYVLRPEAVEVIGRPLLDKFNALDKDKARPIMDRLFSKLMNPTGGRNGDTMLGHIAPGEVVIPPQIMDGELTKHIGAKMLQAGLDPRRYVAGSKVGSFNPNTGSQEFFFDSVLSVAAPVIGGILGGAAGDAIGIGADIGQALGTATGSFIATGDPIEALFTGGFNYLGANLASSANAGSGWFSGSPSEDLGLGFADGLTWNDLLGGLGGTLLGGTIVDAGLPGGVPKSSQNLANYDPVDYSKVQPWNYRGPSNNYDPGNLVEYGYGPEQGFFF